MWEARRRRGPRKSGLSNTFKKSARMVIAARSICSDFWMFTSVSFWPGVRTRLSVRGALPNVNAGGADHAEVLNQFVNRLSLSP